MIKKLKIAKLKQSLGLQFLNIIANVSTINIDTNVAAVKEVNPEINEGLGNKDNETIKATIGLKPEVKMLRYKKIKESA